MMYFEQSIRKDPDNALAHAGLADTYSMMGPYSGLRAAEALPLAHQAAERALQLDSSLPEAHTAHAWVMLWEREWKRSEESFLEAIRLNPGSAQAHLWYGFLLSGLNRLGESELEMRKALEVDPLSLIANSSMGWYLYTARRFEEAHRQFQRTFDLHPDFMRAHFWSGQTLLVQRRYERAIEEHEKALSLSENSLEYLSGLGFAYGRAGRKEQAAEILTRLENVAEEQYVPPLDIALVHIGLGQHDEAFELLHGAFEDQEVWLTWMQVDPRLDPLRDDPRFEDLLRRMNFPE